MPESYFSSRKIRPRFRQEAVAYSITWRLHRGQRPLCGAERAVVAAALMHGNGAAFELHAWVVMNDHVHAVLTATPATSLDAILHSWKGYSASQLMKSPNRAPPIWQKGWYDRVLFSPGAVAAATKYICANPWRRWPELEEYEWVLPVPKP